MDSVKYKDNMVLGFWSQNKSTADMGAVIVWALISKFK